MTEPRYRPGDTVHLKDDPRHNEWEVLEVLPYGTIRIRRPGRTTTRPENTMSTLPERIRRTPK